MSPPLNMMHSDAICLKSIIMFSNKGAVQGATSLPDDGKQLRRAKWLDWHNSTAFPAVSARHRGE